MKLMPSQNSHAHVRNKNFSRVDLSKVKIDGTTPWEVCTGLMMWVFPKIGVPQNGWFMMENPIKMDDLGVPLVSETFMYTPNNREV